MSSPIQANRTEAPGRMGRRASKVAAAWATLATALLLQACGGGGGDGGKDAKVISEALVPDGPSSCSVEAQVYTGPDVHELEGTCLVFVDFALVDPSGNELNVVQPLFTLPPQRTFNFDLQICSGQRGTQIPGVGVFPAGLPSLFLIPDVDRCPSGTKIDVPVPDTFLVRPLQEVSCEDISRVQTTVTPCGS
jgi:hypothetical protein